MDKLDGPSGIVIRDGGIFFEHEETQRIDYVMPVKYWGPFLLKTITGGQLIVPES